MLNSGKTIDEHVGELLSGYIDGELTQQQQQRVQVHCERCVKCAGELERLEELRREIGKSRLSPLGEDIWREHMNESTVRVTRGIGWLIFVAGLLAAGGFAIYEFIIDSSVPLHMKIISALIWGGLAVLLASVIRQRLIERKSDKYKDVEI